MSVLLQEAARKAFDLSPEERAELAHELIVSIDDAADSEVESVQWIFQRQLEIKEGA